MGHVGGGGCDGLVDGDVLDKVRGGAGIGGVFGGGGGGCVGGGGSGSGDVGGGRGWCETVVTCGVAEMFEAVLSEGECCRAKALSLVSSVGVSGGGAVCGESGRVVGEAREECLEVWCSVWWLGDGVLDGVGDG